VFSRSAFDGHDLVAHHWDPESGLRAIVAIHARRDGRGCGGCRMRPYASEAEALEDVLRLSRAMSYKAAMADAPAGGAKAVIIGDPRRDKTEARLLAMGRLIDRFAGSYISAPDVGIGVEDLRVFCRESEWVVGADEVAGPSAPYTALGVLAGMRAAVRSALGREGLDGVRVAIQGVGSVGTALAGLLADAGAALTVADVDAAAVERVVDEHGAQPVGADEILFTEADVLSPCALGGILDDTTIPRLRAAVVCGAANNQLPEPRHGRSLRERGIAYAPDYVVSAGGLIAGMEELSGFDAQAARERVERIEDTLASVFELAARDGVPESDAADRIAEARIASWRLAAR
jgi:leucine dehydrogenase